MIEKLTFYINILPDWIFLAILGSGVAIYIVSFILRFIPITKIYALPVSILAIVLMVTGVYFTGGRITQKAWQAKVDELKEKVTELENRGEKITTVVQERVVKRLEVVRIPAGEIVRYVDREIVKYDNKCDIPTEVIKVHNAAAQNKTVEDLK